MKVFNFKKHIMVISFFCSGCSTKNKFIEYYPNGNIKQVYTLTDKKKYGKEILYFENGNIKSIVGYIENLKEGEQLNFYEKSGLLESKIFFKKDIPNGVAYWFYESGSLRASRNYVNGREDYIGFGYWDDKFVITKSLVRLTDQGHVYYKLNFDSTGKPTNSEGDSLHSGVEHIK